MGRSHSISIEMYDLRSIRLIDITSIKKRLIFYFTQYFLLTDFSCSLNVITHNVKPFVNRESKNFTVSVKKDIKS